MKIRYSNVQHFERNQIKLLRFSCIESFSVLFFESAINEHALCIEILLVHGRSVGFLFGIFDFGWHVFHSNYVMVHGL